jgi:hypothetical protein
MPTLQLRATLLLMTLLLGCGFNNYIGSCRSDSKGYCQDVTNSYGNQDAAHAAAACANTPGGVWSANACDRTGALGGCHEYSKSGLGFTDDDGSVWYWPGSTFAGPTPILTVEDVKARCSNSGGEFEQP